MAEGGEGERLDRFELIAELASGGMATVYLARLGGAGGFQRMVAIKRLHPHLEKEQEFVQMFLDEARLAARIHHPNVVPILEIGTSERGYYLVMEYIEGDTAGHLFTRSIQAGRTVPYEAATRIALDTLAGLHAAHELKDDEGNPLNVVHRDVSPQNILVGADGTSRLTDFGVARAMSRLVTTKSGQLKGKLSYMAPEQARGHDVDRRADVFAMGAVLWEMFALKRLFKGEGEADTLNRVLYEPIPRVRDFANDVPEILDKVVMKALERDRDQRYATAAEFADALEAAAQSLKVLGSTKDVAASLEAVIGTDISQQRQAVRAWLSRSEPQGNGPRVGSIAPPALAPAPAPAQSPPGPAAAAAGGGHGPPSMQTRVERPRGASAGSGTPTSSVSSAVIQVPPPPLLPKTELAAPANTGAPSSVVKSSAPRRRSRALVGFALVAVGAAGWWGVRGHSGAPRVSVAPPAVTAVPVLAATTPAPEPPKTAAPPVVDAPESSASSPAPPVTRAAPPAASAKVVTGRGHTPVRTPKISEKPAEKPPVAPAAPPPPVLPDDISHNPYR